MKIKSQFLPSFSIVFVFLLQLQHKLSMQKPKDSITQNIVEALALNTIDKLHDLFFPFYKQIVISKRKVPKNKGGWNIFIFFWTNISIKVYKINNKKYLQKLMHIIDISNTFKVVPSGDNCQLIGSSTMWIWLVTWLFIYLFALGRKKGKEQGKRCFKYSSYNFQKKKIIDHIKMISAIEKIMKKFKINVQ